MSGEISITFIYIEMNIDSPNDTISLLEAIHARSDLIHLASDITAEDGRPLLDEDTGVLLVPVERVDSNCVVLDHDLSRASSG